MEERKAVFGREHPKGFVCRNILCQKPIEQDADNTRISQGRTIYTCPHCGHKTFLTRNLSSSRLYENSGGTIKRKGLKSSELRKAEKKQRQHEYLAKQEGEDESRTEHYLAPQQTIGPPQKMYIERSMLSLGLIMIRARCRKTSCLMD